MSVASIVVPLMMVVGGFESEMKAINEDKAKPCDKKNLRIITALFIVGLITSQVADVMGLTWVYLAGCVVCNLPSLYIVATNAAHWFIKKEWGLIGGKVYQIVMAGFVVCLIWAELLTKTVQGMTEQAALYFLAYLFIALIVNIVALIRGK